MVSVKILGGDKAGGQSNGGGGEMGGKDTTCMRSRGHVDTECNHTLLKMRILAFLPINPCNST